MSNNNNNTSKEDHPEMMDATLSSHFSSDGSNEKDMEKMSDVFLDDEGSVLLDGTTYNVKKKILSCLATALLVIGFGVAITLVSLDVDFDLNNGSSNSISGADDPKNMSHVTYPRDPAEKMALELLLAQELGDEKYFDPSTSIADAFPAQARQMALHWLLYEDPLQLNATSPNLLQRFILHVFYFQTTRYRNWNECNPPAKGGPDVKQELCFQPVGGWHGNEPKDMVIWGHRWLTAENHECLWAGVLCDRETKQVIELSLAYNGLNGPIPTELVKLSALNDLTLRNNQLTGTIPAVLGSAGTLKRISLGYNRLTGSVPVELFHKRTTSSSGSTVDQLLMNVYLRSNDLTGTIPTEVGLFEGARLDLASNDLSGTLPVELYGLTSVLNVLLGDNPKLAGSLPPQIGQMSNLHRLDLGNTSLTGTLPSQMGLMSQLESLSVDHSSFTGILPSQMGLMSRLEWLSVDYTALTGKIPSQMGLLSELRSLSVDNTALTGILPSQMGLMSKLYDLNISNTKLQGTIPEEFYDSTKLLFVDLSNCQFTGTISTSLGKLKRLKRLEISHNQFSGQLPSQVAELTELRYLEMDNNPLLTGSIPETICLQAEVRDRVDFRIVADCTPNDITLEAAMDCSCCTACCSSETGACTNN